MRTAQIIVVSDRAVDDPSENRAGPILEECLRDNGLEVASTIIPSVEQAIDEALAAAVAMADVVVTTGGTGIRAGDLVVDRTLALDLVELPGLMEEVRRRGADKTSVSLLSRAVAGLVERGGRRVLVVNAPSSRGGARDVADVLSGVLPHVARDLAGAERS